jgi:hypothetical protein
MKFNENIITIIKISLNARFSSLWYKFENIHEEIPGLRLGQMLINSLNQDNKFKNFALININVNALLLNIFKKAVEDSDINYYHSSAMFSKTQTIR